MNESRFDDFYEKAKTNPYVDYSDDPLDHLVTSDYKKYWSSLEDEGRDTNEFIELMKSIFKGDLNEIINQLNTNYKDSIDKFIGNRINKYDPHNTKASLFMDNSKDFSLENLAKWLKVYYSNVRYIRNINVNSPWEYRRICQDLLDSIGKVEHKNLINNIKYLHFPPRGETLDDVRRELDFLMKYDIVVDITKPGWDKLKISSPNTQEASKLKQEEDRRREEDHKKFSDEVDRRQNALFNAFERGDDLSLGNIPW